MSKSTPKHEVKITIKNEDDLKEHFHSIHDYIRNKFGFYGKSALQFFNLLFVLKLIEPIIKKLTDGKIIAHIDMVNAIANKNWYNHPDISLNLLPAHAVLLYIPLLSLLEARPKPV